MTQKVKRPQFVNGVRVRMPDDYDFSTKGKNWSQYDKDYRLRTDAVWQKTQLKDWFRLSKKFFWFNIKLQKYQFIENHSLYSLMFEPWGFEKDDLLDFDGYTPTGATASFEIGLPGKVRGEDTFNSYYSMPDMYMICPMRFNKWFRCDMIYGQDRIAHYDMNPNKGLTNLKMSDHYPCFREYYDARYACADNLFDMLMELAYHKKARNFWSEAANNVQIQSFPTSFDSPNDPETVTFTY